jgi:hypothetical protein
MKSKAGTVRSFSFLFPVLLLSFFAAADCAPLAAQTQPVQDASPASPQNPRALSRLPDMTIAHGRLKIDLPSGPLRLGEENPLTIALQGPTVKSVLVSATKEDPHGGEPCGDDRGAGLAAVVIAGAGFAPPPQLTKLEPALQQRPDGSHYLNFVPQCLGKVRVRVTAIFSDGAWEFEDVEREVVAASPPEKIDVGAGMPLHSALRMDLSERGRRQRLGIEATWSSVKKPLWIPAQDAKFSVIQTKGEPAIRLDPQTGWIDALRLGHALIETSYGGLTQTACVLVTENAQAFSRAQCEELQPGGDRILPTAREADAPGTWEESKLPYTAMDGRRGRFLADDRADVTPPAHPLQIAENNPIQMTVHGPSAVVRMECHNRQQQPCEPWTDPPSWNRSGLPFTHNGNATASAQVFPTQLGPDEFTFFILFADGGVALKKVSADVEPGTVKPRAIGERCARGPASNPMLPVRLNIGSSSMKYEDSSPLSVFACYDGILNPLIPPANLVKYTVESDGSDPVVELDPAKGTVTGHRPGQALVQEEFAALTETRCIIVVPWERRGEPDLSNCRALRAKYGPPLTPVAAAVDPSNLIQNPPSATSTQTGVVRFAGAPAIGVPQVSQLGNLSAPATVPRIDPITAGTLSPTARDRFAADDRLEISLSGVTAVLGQPTPLPIRLHGPEPLAMRMYQERVRFMAQRPPVQREESAFEYQSEPNAIFRNPDGSLFVNVTAMQAGKAEFRIAVLFADGGVATRRVEIPVKLPNEKPQLINALDDNMADMPATPVTTLHLLTKPPTNTRALFPFVSFGSQPRMIPLRPTDVTFSLKNAGTDPVVGLDAVTGTLTALRVGHALVTTRFAGAQSETCVVVMDDAVRGDPSNCEDLRTSTQAANP